MKKYVLGFAFDRLKNMVVLIEKQKPEWQKGCLNGVGGKVEATDTDIYHSMCREFHEETGVPTLMSSWYHFADMTFENDVMGGGAIVHCFRMYDDIVFNCQTVESEKVIHFSLLNPPKCPVIKNLNVLIPMAVDEDFQFCNLNIL